MFLMTKAEELAAFVVGTKYEDLSSEAVEQLKIRVLDSLGCGLAALGQGPTKVVRDHVREFCPKRSSASVTNITCWFQPGASSSMS
jgi:2-methylcitrate dehydratase PrpD